MSGTNRESLAVRITYTIHATRVIPLERYGEAERASIARLEKLETELLKEYPSGYVADGRQEIKTSIDKIELVKLEETDA